MLYKSIAGSECGLAGPVMGTAPWSLQAEDTMIYHLAIIPGSKTHRCAFHRRGKLGHNGICITWNQVTSKL